MRPAAAFAVLALLPGSTAATQVHVAPAYPLACRGGGAMELRVHRHLMVLWFRGAARGADVASPAPGECAWLDRGFRPGEPTVLLWWTGDGIDVTTLLGKHHALPRPPAAPPPAMAMQQVREPEAPPVKRERMVLDLFSSTKNQAALTRVLAQAVAADRDRRARATAAKADALADTWIDRLEFEGDDAARAAAYMYLYRAVERGELFFVSVSQTDRCRFRTMARCLIVARVGP